jgi:diguanylate cyclase (GGDEF)-like protein/PAS domain S-box-containing protein
MFDNPEFYKDLIDNLYDGIYFVDRDRRINYWNNGAERITGYKFNQVIGRFCRDNILNHITADGTLLCLNGCPLAASMDDGKPREAEVFLHHHDGHRLPVVVRVSPIRNKDGEIIGAVETFSNNEQVIQTRRQVDELRQSAFTDPLTGIGNRRYLEEGIRAARAAADRGIGIAGLILIDIDNLKQVNDTYGHEVGDQILLMVVRTLKHSLRGTDLLGRWGGDEFIAIIQDVQKLDTLQDVAKKLCVMVENSRLDLEIARLSITISIGATLVKMDETPENIFQRADQFLYKSKQAGRNQITIE